MRSRERSGIPHKDWTGQPEPQESLAELFGARKQDGTKGGKERGVTEYHYCDECRWHTNAPILYEALEKFQIHNDDKHDGKAHLVKKR